MNQFILESKYQAAGDQPAAIAALVRGIQAQMKEQVLVGVTGSGKTYTMASVIEKLNRPALIISHNKTLAAQLYQEFRDFFPKNAVSYFVSYYDYYQPEAYVASTDTYIEKETEINEEIDKLRLAATTNILTRPDAIVVASVSCIYNIGSPKEYGNFVLELQPGAKVSREQIILRLTNLQYERSDYGFHRSTFRVRGDAIDVFPAYEDRAIRIIVGEQFINHLSYVDPLTGAQEEVISGTVLYPAKHYMTDPKTYHDVFEKIRADLDEQEAFFKSKGKLIEAQRIRQRVEYDLEMLAEIGFVNGIENYSRYFDGREPGSAPFSLFEYFQEAYGDEWLLFIDESHMTIPQVRGMYNGDRSRKQTLIDFGFRLPAALDNRPLRFDEFLRILPQTIYVSATPDEWEMERVSSESKRVDDPALTGVVEQLVRPTGLIDPVIEVRPVKDQIPDLLKEIQMRVEKHERVLVTTLTKRMAEDLSKFLEEKEIKVHYLHADILTLERSDILADLRKGKYDVIVGINLLREGLDLPEVSLVAILDADKEGFLRSRTSLIQTMGRAARNVGGKAILYGDVMTRSMKAAMEEVERRREVQLAYNAKHCITPESISKPIRADMVEHDPNAPVEGELRASDVTKEYIQTLTPKDAKESVKKLRKAMQVASHDLNFELAAQLRDTIARIEKEVGVGK